MAEQIFNIKSGFFNAVNNDRTYTAEDMNKPYKRIVSNGVFATNSGTPSSDFQVLASSGMVLNVQPGNAIVKSKWMESSIITPITVPANTGLITREDGVFLQIDDTTRTGNIVYRSGDTSPESGELLLAIVSVAAGATSLTQTNISDKRGSADCPWVTGLISQVDTSTLFAQYETAYAEQFSAYQQQIAQNINTANAEWAAALEDLSDELTVSTNIITATSFYSVGTDGTSTIPIQIAGFDSATDLLLVYINGLCAPSSMYTISGSNIVLTNALDSGDSVLFVCFKALINGSIASAAALLQEMQNLLSQFLNDTGWVPVTLINGATGNDMMYRSIGGRVTFAGRLSSWTSGTPIFQFPAELKPSHSAYYSIPIINGSTVKSPVFMTIGTGGNVTITGSGSSGDYAHIYCDFLSVSAAGWGNALVNADDTDY